MTLVLLWIIVVLLVLGMAVLIMMIHQMHYDQMTMGKDLHNLADQKESGFIMMLRAQVKELGRDWQNAVVEAQQRKAAYDSLKLEIADDIQHILDIQGLIKYGSVMKKLRKIHNRLIREE